MSTGRIRFCLIRFFGFLKASAESLLVFIEACRSSDMKVKFPDQTSLA